MNITEALSDLLEAKVDNMTYQEYCENFPALITKSRYDETTASTIFVEIHKLKGNI